LFVKIKKLEQAKVLETEHVLKFIKQGKDLNPIPQDQIDVLKRIEGVDCEIEVGPTIYSIGDEVEVVKGTLAGLKGRMVSRLGKKQFVVEIDAIGVSLQLNIDINMLHKKRSVAELTA
jgi:transcription antitermination factor NusG